MQIPGINIRRATVSDADAILGCLHSAFEPYRKHYTYEGFADTTLTVETLQQRMAWMHVFIALDESSAVVGTIACQMLSSGEGHIRGMAVLPAMHGRGIAKRLLAHAEAHLESQGARRVTLDTTSPLQRAIHFYEKHGYRPTGKVGDFFGMRLFEYVKELLSAWATSQAHTSSKYINS